ncbi:hypothetical protein [Deinococcus wulumuqiensis]|uniref:DUF4333 domain-containing protein n=1 Tax=Deinococcus wulumuqiensis TaxID=980427 RepID=A0AAV4K3I6_9DEIO|nr:hypothetical protein [Deinococcus wulumuqiensis]QII20342.1 hypothetical protein G6R31_05855 [Deinococcus wulumuqiensis R12]GGI81848.1 hypothetical protein GCM10010914_15130 [Deinococcus wulumuqiensis]GGP30105.1 hypothetical protein GCM10008021_17560 [Deinococcus wulumuqiensis]
MSAPSRPEQREITPAERCKMTRTFLLIVLLFLGGVAAMVAVMSVQGRAAREYGGMVIRAAGPQSTQVNFDRPCTDVLPGKAVPPNVTACTLEVRGGAASVVLEVEGERQYRVTR